MSTVDRRYFIMSSVALPAALKASALQSPNDTVRVAVVGFNGRGRAHIQAYLKTPNVEIAALCDVDQSVIDSGCKTIESAGRKRPATYTDFRKLLEDKTIDAVSIATPNFHHTLQTIWAVQAGKDVLVEKPVSYNMFEARQIVAAARLIDAIQKGVQHAALVRAERLQVLQPRDLRAGQFHFHPTILQPPLPRFQHADAGGGEPRADVRPRPACAGTKIAGK